MSGKPAKDSDIRHRVAELKTKLAIQDARIMSNPRPYLNEMSKTIGELLRVIEEIDYALSPDAVFDVWSESADKRVFSGPADINGEALIRCNKALKVLREWRSR
jgi:hypothetical protein